MNVRKLVEECTFTLKGFDSRRGNYLDHRVDYEKLVKLVAQECIGLIDKEIESQKNVQTFNDFDKRWVEGKILHFGSFRDKVKAHFGVTDVV